MLIACAAASTVVPAKSTICPLLIAVQRGFVHSQLQIEVKGYRMDLREIISQRIQDAFPDTQVTLTDMTGGGDHWEAMIVSPAFEGMSRLQRQRGVYAALGELMHGPIHALTFRTLTPEQFESENT